MAGQELKMLIAFCKREGLQLEYEFQTKESLRRLLEEIGIDVDKDVLGNKGNSGKQEKKKRGRKG